MSAIGDYAWRAVVGLVFAATLMLIAMTCIAALVWLVPGHRNLQRTWNYLVPLFAAFDLLARRWFVAATIAGVAVVLTRGVPDGVIPWPAAGSLERQYGEKIFAILWVLFVAEALWSGGFPPSLERGIRLQNIQVFRSMAFILSIAAAVWPGNYLVGAFLTSAVYLAFALHFGRRLALRAFFGSEAITPHSLAAPPAGTDPLFIQLTDLHIAAGPTKPRVEPGKPGNTRLAELPARLKGRPRWIFMTGDLVDHGHSDEWEAATDLLRPLKDGPPGSRIVLTPGNHDIGAAYNTLDNIGAQLLARHRRNILAEADSSYLRRYLARASQLEPELRVASGALLTQMIEDDAAAEVELLERLGTLASAPSAQGRSDFAARGSVLYADVAGVHWDQTQDLTVRGFRDVVVPGLWLRRWYTLFPLWCHDAERDELIIVLNSVAPDPTHIGGAWGSFGEFQANHLRTLLEMHVRRTFVLCHHAPVRWRGEPPPPRFAIGANVEWSATSILAEEIVRLRDILAGALRKGSGDIIFLCGHRHGGVGHQARVGSWPGGILVEGASFADPGTPIVAGWETEEGLLEIGAMSV